jgi:hypothetical protein
MMIRLRSNQVPEPYHPLGGMEGGTTLNKVGAETTAHRDGSSTSVAQVARVFPNKSIR